MTIVPTRSLQQRERQIASVVRRACTSWAWALSPNRCCCVLQQECSNGSSAVFSRVSLPAFRLCGCADDQVHMHVCCRYLGTRYQHSTARAAVPYCTAVLVQVDRSVPSSSTLCCCDLLHSPLHPSWLGETPSKLAAYRFVSGPGTFCPCGLSLKLQGT